MGARQSYYLGCSCNVVANLTRSQPTFPGGEKLSLSKASHLSVLLRDEVVVEVIGVSTTCCLPGRTGLSTLQHTSHPSARVAGNYEPQWHDGRRKADGLSGST